jgi:hypothetical protein
MKLAVNIPFKKKALRPFIYYKYEKCQLRGFLLVVGIKARGTEINEALRNVGGAHPLVVTPLVISHPPLPRCITPKLALTSNNMVLSY